VSILDAAKAKHPATHITTSSRVERILQRLTAAGLPADERAELEQMLAAPLDDWGNARLCGILRFCCDELSVDHEGLEQRNVGDYRKKLRS